MWSLKGKVALVTGSSRGLGFGFAGALAQAGATVVINGRNSAAVSRRVKELRSKKFSVESSVFDVTNPESVRKAIPLIEKKTGPIDILVNNVGIQRRALLEKMSLEEWDEVIRTNLSSVFMVTRHVVPGMIKRKRGKIINVFSLMCERARPSTGNYAAAKGGLKMLTKTMAAEWGRYNIQVNGIGPGYFITDLTKKLAKDRKFDSWVRSKIPLGRWGVSEDLSGTLVFLASHASDYVTGQAIYVDGGWLATL